MSCHSDFSWTRLCSTMLSGLLFSASCFLACSCLKKSATTIPGKAHGSWIDCCVPLSLFSLRSQMILRRLIGEEITKWGQNSGVYSWRFPWRFWNTWRSYICLSTDPRNYHWSEDRLSVLQTKFYLTQCIILHCFVISKQVHGSQPFSKTVYSV